MKAKACLSLIAHLVTKQLNVFFLNCTSPVLLKLNNTNASDMDTRVSVANGLDKCIKHIYTIKSYILL